MSLSIRHHPISLFSETGEIEPIMQAFNSFLGEILPEQSSRTSREYYYPLRRQQYRHSCDCERRNRLIESINKDLILSQDIRNYLGDQMLERFLRIHSGDNTILSKIDSDSKKEEKKEQDESDGKSSHFEMVVNLHDCDPSKIAVEVKDGVVRVEGCNQDEDGTFVYRRQERTIPKYISPSSLKASLLSDGKLKISGEQTQAKILQVTREEEKKNTNTNILAKESVEEIEKK